MPARVTITIPDAVMADVEAQKPRSLSLAAFLALLVDKGLTLGGESSEPPSKAVTSSKKTSYKPNKESVPDALSPYLPLIFEFWQTKKGAKSETAWSFLIENLERIRDKYGPHVLEEQLKLAINGKWFSIQLKNLEQFSQPTQRGAAPSIKPRKKTEAELAAEKEAEHQERLRKFGLI